MAQVIILGSFCGVWSESQLVEYLFNILKARNSIPGTHKKRERGEKKKRTEVTRLKCYSSLKKGGSFLYSDISRNI